MSHRDTVSRNALYRIARIEYEKQRLSMTPDQRARALLDAAIAQIDDTRDYTAWGPLRKPMPDRSANDALLEWAAESVAQFVPLRHIAHPALEPRCVFVSSQQITHALKLWNDANRPADDFVLSGDWCFIDSFARLQSELLPQRGGGGGGRQLIDLPHWERIAFILNEQYHWSVLMLIREPDSGKLTLMLYDSLMCVHTDMVLRVCELLYATGLLSREVKPVQAATTATQNSMWECGYAVMARLFEHGTVTFDNETIPLPPDIPTSADTIIRNKASSRPLKTFLTYLRDRCEFACELSVLYRRWDRSYQK